MKKKLLAAVLAGMLALGMVACSGDDDPGTGDTPTDAAS
jgi:ABC-type glycerol-3-phosphate transport system substrate-binding protein